MYLHKLCRTCKLSSRQGVDCVVSLFPWHYEVSLQRKQGCMVSHEPTSMGSCSCSNGSARRHTFGHACKLRPRLLQPRRRMHVPLCDNRCAWFPCFFAWCPWFSLLHGNRLGTDSRLNALLGGSVLHPRGGGYALAALASPAVLATICVSGCASVWLYAVLVEEQVRPSNLTHCPRVHVTHQILITGRLLFLRDEQYLPPVGRLCRLCLSSIRC